VVRGCSAGGGNDMHRFHLHVTKCYRKREAYEHNVLVFGQWNFQAED